MDTSANPRSAPQAKRANLSSRSWCKCSGPAWKVLIFAVEIVCLRILHPFRRTSKLRPGYTTAFTCPGPVQCSCASLAWVSSLASELSASLTVTGSPGFTRSFGELLVNVAV